MNSNSNKGKEYAKDPLYEKLLAAFQSGKWVSAKRFATRLSKKYPDAAEIADIRKDIDLRQGIEKTQQEEDQDRKQKTNRRRLYVGAVVVVLGVVSYFVYQNYAAGLQQRAQETSLEVNLADRFRNAENLLQSGRAAEAKVILDELRDISPDYPGLNEALAEAEERLYLDSLYEQATELLSDENYLQALDVLNMIYEIDPGYKDVKILLDDTQLKASLASEYRADAETAYAEENWLVALGNYEAALDTFPDIRDQSLVDHLYESYLEAANELLGASSATLDDLDQAEAYYQQALLLRSRDSDATRQKLNTQELLVNQYYAFAQNVLARNSDGIDEIETATELFGKALLINPDDDLVQAEYDLAKSYLAAFEDYNSGEWVAVVSDLEEINAVRPDYANGSARQLYYEALINLGNEQMQSEAYNSAYSYFESAQDLAQESFATVLPLYQAQIKMAQAQGELGMFREAAILYRASVEATQMRLFPSLQGSEFLTNVIAADSLFFSGDNEGAYQAYQDLLDLSAEFIVLAPYEVHSGDYLVRVARENGSTVEALTIANGLSFDAYPIQVLSLQIPIVTGE